MFWFNKQAIVRACKKMGEKTSGLGSERQRYTNCKSLLPCLTTSFQGYLIGNKNDVNQDRQVITDKEANKLATELGLKYFKVLNDE